MSSTKLISAPSYRADNTPQKITAGILVKYVNLGKGWRRRLVVVQGSSVQYYKVDGPTKVSVQTVLEGLRRSGNLVLVGAEVQVLEGKTHHFRKSSRSGSFKSENMPAAYFDGNLKGAEVTTSESDVRKFYVVIGDLYLRLRAETEGDKEAWLDAFAAASGSAKLLSEPRDSLLYNEAELVQLQQEGRAELAAMGAPEPVLAYVQQLLARQYEQYRATLAMETHKCHDLQAHLKSIEDEKRQLETSMVVEQMQQRPHGAASIDDDATSDGDGSELGEVGGRSISDASDEFYDCRSYFPSHTESPDLDASIPDGGYPDAREPAAGSHLPPGGSQAPPESANGAPAAVQPRPSPSRVSPQRGMSMGQRSASVGLRNTSRGVDNLSNPSSSSQPNSRWHDRPEWLEAEMPPPHRREGLPKPAQNEKSVSLWSILKDVVGRDLSKVCLPVYFNEPTSALQKIAEELEYSRLLDEAAELPAGSQERLVKIAGFAVSAYAGTSGRTNKPFNPLLGETYEFVCAEQGFRFIAEKVVHHPTVIAAYAEGRKWTFQGDVDLKSKFWGRSIELMPQGALLLDFHDGDQYVWHKVTSSVNNLIIGKLYVDHNGTMRIRNTQSNLTARLKFHEAGMFNSKDSHLVKGGLEQNGEKIPDLELIGKWDEGMSVKRGHGPAEQLWVKSPAPANPTRYNLTGFCMKLNELTPGLEGKLAPTDCRLRPDQRATELGQYDKANQEKLRLEKKQRAARAAADRGDAIKPRWFKANPGKQDPDDLAFVYTGGYFESRAAHNYEGCRDIFGQDMPEVAAS